MDIIHDMNEDATTQGRPLPRALAPRLTSLLRSFPAVVVTGARQTGKSTLVQQLPGQPRRMYLTLDDLDVLERARLEPAALVGSGAGLLLHDGAETAWLADGVLATPWWRVV